jgi:hypothetical protein
MGFNWTQGLDASAYIEGGAAQPVEENSGSVCRGYTTMSGMK